MPRSNSSFGVAEGGSVVSAGPAPGARGAARRRIGRAADIGEIQRLAGAASAGSADRAVDSALGRHRKLTAAERARRAGRIGILVGIEGVATPAPGLRRASRFLHDRRRRGDLLLRIARLLIVRGELHRRRGGDAGLGDRGRSAGGGLRTTLQRLQALFELPVAVLQLLVLAGELPQLILKLLDTHFRIDGVGLRKSL